MVPHAMVRQFAAGQQIGLDVADQDVVLHYVLELLSRAALFQSVTGERPGPLLFKGGTALRKCVFGETGRFSQDIDVDATHKNGFEATIEAAFSAQRPFYDISFSIPGFRYSAGGNFSGHVSYEHEHGSGNFELQISYRLEPILDPVNLQLRPQPYFEHVEFAPPALSGLDPYEMIGEKVMACNRRLGGSAKDVYSVRRGPRTAAGHAEGLDRPARSIEVRAARVPGIDHPRQLPLGGSAGPRPSPATIRSGRHLPLGPWPLRVPGQMHAGGEAVARGSDLAP